MAVTDYNTKKNLEVTSTNDSGSTIDKAQPVLLVGGDDSTTGTGDIVLDWTNISSESDIAVYDQDGNLLNYEIESFDASAETAVLWCYNSWVRDDSVQAQVVYGDGPQDAEDVVEEVWNNTGQNAVMVQHLQDDPLTATDSTANDNDGTVTGVTSTSNGVFDNAADFDGTDDTVNSITVSETDGVKTWVAWVNADSNLLTDSNNYSVLTTSDSGYSATNLKKTSSSRGETFDFQLTNGSDTVDTVDIDSTQFEGDGYVLLVGKVDSNNNAYIYGWNSTTGLVSDSISLGFSPVSDEGIFIGSDEDSGRYWSGSIDEAKLYQGDSKSESWIQAEVDASPKAGQVFFTQDAAEPTQDTNLGLTTTATATGSGETVNLSGSTTASTTAASATGTGATIFIEPDFGTLAANGTGTGATISVSGSSTLNLTAASATGTGSTSQLTPILTPTAATATGTGATLEFDRLSGTVTVEGQPSEGVDVNIVDKTNNVLYETVSDSNGDWIIDSGDGAVYHVSYLFDDGSTYYGDAEESDTT